ncbi:uncharacterized protein DUF2785 [Tumebacillus sp. BK434]|uniref:DUF2785 domain-containing protein n=1 Tax=Tumebacillus sp. BK434 TaxID=2512169 RepID=UPI00104C61D9|nr:DUF2785 domain-containing protein [Tumebacillus sp. BK434]TCP58075.1 uncharacterized protein DUF2785 [Tumebacillus sp. BK434]
MNLTQELEIIKQQEYRLAAGQDLMELTHAILDQLGSTDAYLRDSLGYSTLANWLYKQDEYSLEQLREILQRVLGVWNEGIGEKESDGVFLRSFASLVVALVLLQDNKTPFLTEEEFRTILARTVAYCQQERDFRGFVEPGGWAHAAAHVADVVDECVKHRLTGEAECELLWQGLRALIRNADFVYGAEEDERITNALLAMIDSGKVPLAKLCAWLEAEECAGESYHKSFTLRINWKHLVRSLEFRLRVHNLAGDCEDRLFGLLQKFASHYA